MNDALNDFSLVVIGAARGTEVALARVLTLLPLPMQAAVVVTVQGLDQAAVARLLALGPPELRLLSGPQALQPPGVWLAPPGQVVRVDGNRLVPQALVSRRVITPLFASASGRRVLGVLLGDTGADGEAAAAALGDAPLLRPDPRRVPNDEAAHAEPAQAARR